MLLVSLRHFRRTCLFHRMTPVLEGDMFDRTLWESEVAANAGVSVSLSVFNLCDDFLLPLF